MMRLSTPTERIPRTFGLERTVDMICDAGFDAIDFTACNLPEWYDDTHDKAFYENIRKRAEDRGVVFNQTHAPFPSSVKSEEETEVIFGNIVKSMKHSSYLGIETVVVHPCQHLTYVDEGNAERLFEYNMKFYRKLIPYAEEYGVKVALENMWQYMGKSTKIIKSTCATPDEFVRYMDELDNECFTACLDIGHAILVCEDVPEFIHKLGKRLGALHVHDVDGTTDTHVLPFFGVGEWDKITKALAEVDYKGDFTYEADRFLFDKPTELWPAYLKLMESTGRYLIGKIEEYKK